MTDEQLIERFNKINLEFIHLKSQFDHLLNSINAFSESDVRLTVFESKIESFKTTLDSMVSITESNNTELTSLKAQVTQLDNVVNEGRPISDPFDPTIHDYDNTPPA